MAHWTRSLVLALCAIAAVAAEAKSALNKATFEAYLRHLNLWPKEVTVAISDPTPSRTLPGFQDVKVRASLGPRFIDTSYLVSNDGQKILQANVYDITWNPFREDLAKLTTTGAPALGTAGAPVVIVLFSDFQCSYCREEAKILRDNLVKTYPKEVRLYFKDYPLEQIHPWARAAAVAGRCVLKQKDAAFWDFHDWIFDKQADITIENLKQKALAWAADKVDAVQLSACIDTKATDADVAASIALGRSLSVTGTPMFFINGRRLSGNLAWDQLKQIIDTEIEYQKTAKNAGEDCGCEIGLPAPGTKLASPASQGVK